MKDTKKNTFIEDLNSRLPDVQRVWLRRTVTVIITPLCWITLVAYSIWDTTKTVWNDFTLDCWYGRN